MRVGKGEMLLFAWGLLSAGFLLYTALVTPALDTGDTRDPKQGKQRRGATTLRCNTCLTNWPPYEDFDPCPRCEDAVRNIQNDKPDFDYDEARQVANHLEFEKYYEATRGTTV